MSFSKRLHLSKFIYAAKENKTNAYVSNIWLKLAMQKQNFDNYPQVEMEKKRKVEAEQKKVEAERKKRERLERQERELKDRILKNMKVRYFNAVQL